MPTLFHPADVSEMLKRIEKLTPNTQNQWGKMNVSQMMAHCHMSLETAMGKHVIKPMIIGGIIGRILKPKVLGPKPFGKNSPTDKSYKFPSDVNFEEQRSKITNAVKEFLDGGPSKCTTHPHPFFGHFTPEQWAVFQWKHLDHHLRQFGV